MGVGDGVGVGVGVDDGVGVGVDDGVGVGVGVGRDGATAALIFFPLFQLRRPLFRIQLYAYPLKIIF